MDDIESGASSLGGQSTSRKFVLAYLTTPEAPGGGFTGALLITDERTRPLEFMCAKPLRPTIFQRMLYGKTLWEHAVIDVIAHKLLTSTTRRPDVLFVAVPELLAVRRIADVPVLMLSKSATEDPSRSLGVLNYKAAEGYQSDADNAGIIVGEVEQQIDLFEPFQRAGEALKESLKVAG